MIAGARPFAYIRRSTTSRGDPGDQSRDFQTDTVRRLAGKDAAALVILGGDWGRSAAGDKTDKRLDFLRLLDMIEAGEVSHVYAYAPDRLARSVEWSARLVNACRRAGVPITTTAGTVLPDDPGARMLFNMLALVNENALDQIEQKRRATVTVQRAKGVILGQKPYGDQNFRKDMPAPFESWAGKPEPWRAVVDAFKEAGTYHGAVRLLTTRGVPSRRAHLGHGWEASTVLRIIAHAVRPITDPKGGRGITDVTMPTTTKRGVYTVGTHLFTRLLICPHDGSIMTTIPHAGGRVTSYSCRIGHRDISHPRPYIISENAILPLVKSWLAKVVKAQTHKVDIAGIVTNVTALQDERARVIAYGIKGRLTDAEVDAQLADLDARLADLESIKRSAVTIEYGIDWDAPVGIVNARLRELLSGIRLEYADAIGEVVKGRHTRTRTLVVGAPVWRIEHPERFDVELPDDAEIIETDHRAGTTFPIDPKLVKAATRKARKRS